MNVIINMVIIKNMVRIVGLWERTNCKEMGPLMKLVNYCISTLCCPVL